MLERSAKGKKTPTTLHEVEKGAIRRFAEALGDLNPLYYDESYAKAAGFRSIPTPPTFPLSFNVATDLRDLLGVNSRQLLHSETAFEYVRAIVAGDRILVTSIVAEVGERQSGAGKVEVAVVEDEGRDEEGNVIFRTRRTFVVRASKEAP